MPRHNIDILFIKLLHTCMRRNCEGCIGKRQELCNDIFSNTARRISNTADATEKMVLAGDIERGFNLNEGIQKNIIGSLFGDLTIVKCELTTEEVQARLLEESSKT